MADKDEVEGQGRSPKTEVLGGERARTILIENGPEPSSTNSWQTAKAVAKVLAGVNTPLLGFSIELSPTKRKAAKRSLEEQKALVVQELIDNDIDPLVFDSLLTSEQNRRLKIAFGTIFLLMTLAVTGCSYALVVLNAVYDWNVSELAITALVIETPIQFVGLLYVIARNLFPVSEESSASLAGKGVTILGSTSGDNVEKSETTG